MALPNNSTIYRTQNWEDEYKRARFGSADDLTRKQERQFNRYARSKKGEAARIAYDKAEMDKFNQSVDRALTSRKEAMQKAATDFTASITPPSVPVVKDPPPALVLKDAARWNQVASQYGFKDYNDVAAWQRENGLTVDGKFGSNSYTKWSELNPGKVGTVPVIKPRTVVPKQKPDVVVPDVDPTSKEFVGPVLKSDTPVDTSTPTPKSNVFNWNKFKDAFGLETFDYDGKTYARYDPNGLGDFAIGQDGTIYHYASNGKLGLNQVTKAPVVYTLDQPHTGTFKENLQMLNGIMAPYRKQGGTMNRINYFQQGGTAPQQDIKAQITALVQAAMQGDQKATETVNKIMEAAKAGDQQAVQLAQIIQEVAKQIQGQAATAKWGSKLNYIRSLKFAKGGKTCLECEKGAPTVEKKACGGKKAKKRYFGGLV